MYQGIDRGASRVPQGRATTATATRSQKRYDRGSSRTTDGERDTSDARGGGASQHASGGGAGGASQHAGGTLCKIENIQRIAKTTTGDLISTREKMRRRKMPRNGCFRRKHSFSATGNTWRRWMSRWRVWSDDSSDSDADLMRLFCVVRTRKTCTRM